MAGTQITTSDTSNGIAIAFTTTGDVAYLRARVRQIAEMHNRMTGMSTGGPRGRGMEMHKIPSYVSVEEVPGGVRLVFVPTDPSQLEALRQQVHMHAERMQSGQCPPCPQCPPPSAPAPAPGSGSEQPPPGAESEP